MLRNVYLAAGVVFTALGLWLRKSPWSYLPLTAGVGYLLVGLAYRGRWTGVLGKRRDGRLMFSSYLLFWPYHLMNWLTWGLFRWGVRENPFDEVAPGVFLGGRLLSSDRTRFQAARIASTLDLTVEFSEIGFIRATRGYACLPVLDRTPLSLAELRVAVQFIEQRLASGPVFVHCALGHGRSAMAVAAWLLHKRMARSPAAAVAQLREKRPGVRPASGQMRALEEFAKTYETGNF